MARRKESTSKDADQTSSVNFSWRLLKKKNTVGIGPAPTVETNASTSIAFLQATNSSEILAMPTKSKKWILRRRSMRRETDFSLRTNQVIEALFRSVGHIRGLLEVEGRSQDQERSRSCEEEGRRGEEE